MSMYQKSVETNGSMSFIQYIKNKLIYVGGYLLVTRAPLLQKLCLTTLAVAMFDH